MSFMIDDRECIMQIYPIHSAVMGTNRPVHTQGLLQEPANYSYVLKHLNTLKRHLNHSDVYVIHWTLAKHL